MKNNLQALREYQNRVDLSELEKSIYISIDRLTVILDRDNCSLRRIQGVIRAFFPYVEKEGRFLCILRKLLNQNFCFKSIIIREKSLNS